MSYQIKAISKFVFIVQICLNAFITLGFGIQQRKFGYFFLVVLNLLGLIIYDHSNRKKLIKINRFFQIIIQAILIPFSISLLIQATIYNWNSWLVYIIILYGVIMYIPYTVILIGAIKTRIMQLIVSVFLFIFNGLSSLDIMVMDTYVANNHIIRILSDSSFLGALTFTAIILVAMLEWNYGFPKIHFSRQMNFKVLIAVCLFSIWFVIWNAFGSGENILNLFTSYDFKMNLTITNFLSGLEAGIAEELVFRFVFITIILSIFKNNRFKLYYAVLLSSLMFGLIHLSNTSAGQNLNNTIIQVIFAISLGIFLASIYLYTDCFFIPVIIHALMDILVFAASNTQIMTGKVTTDDFIFTAIEALIFMVIGFILLNLVDRRRKFNFYF